MEFASRKNWMFVGRGGKDGRDDGGQRDSIYDTQPGDLLYRMPPVQAQP